LILDRVAVRVDTREIGQPIIRFDPPPFLRPNAIAIFLPAGQPSITDLQFGADDAQLQGGAPLREVRVKRGGDDNNSVAASLVPIDSLHGLASDDPWQNVAGVPRACLANL